MEHGRRVLVATQQLPTSPGHVFYEKLNELLAEGSSYTWIEELCESYYAKRGRPGFLPACTFGCCWPGTSKVSARSGALRGGAAIPRRYASSWGSLPQKSPPDHSSLFFDRGM